jgi:hypothetical protein
MKTEETLTILLPTIDRNFARAALACLEAQTHKHLNIIISDNTHNGEIFNSFKSIVPNNSNTKVNLLHPFSETKGDVVAHHKILVNKVSTKYYKFLFDDDLLSPLSVQYLYQIAKEGNFPAVFHNRYNFSDDKITIAIPQSLEFNDSILKILSFEQIGITLFSHCFNIFSEPSFSLYRKDTIDINRLGVYIDGLQLRYLGDVAHPLLVAEKFGNIAISGARLGYFRRHSAQDSSPNSPNRLSGLIEWELISRYLNQKMNFSTALVDRNKARLGFIYQKGEKQFPFLLERYKNVILSDDKYVLDQNFKNFYKRCEDFQKTKN